MSRPYEDGNYTIEEQHGRAMTDAVKRTLDDIGKGRQLLAILGIRIKLDSPEGLAEKKGALEKSLDMIALHLRKHHDAYRAQSARIAALEAERDAAREDRDAAVDAERGACAKIADSAFSGSGNEAWVADQIRRRAALAKETPMAEREIEAMGREEL